ncbi:MAG: hypothetical protein QM635_12005 [Microbacteriaceae bacterium]
MATLTTCIDCGSSHAGHAVMPIQERVAAASPRRWQDAIVVWTDAAGRAGLAGLDGAQRTVWHHAPVFRAGDPVAVHAIAGVVSVDGELVSVSVL